MASTLFLCLGKAHRCTSKMEIKKVTLQLLLIKQRLNAEALVGQHVTQAT